jgi:hypothetical protein
MSLLGVYVIIGYYTDAKRSTHYRHKITNQRFDTEHIKQKVNEILSYQSDALHWNLFHVGNVGKVGQRALKSYDRISRKLNVEMHSRQTAEKRIAELLKGKDDFMKLSRALAEKAQRRERLTIQPKEKLSGAKAIITIQNYFGGYYYFTSDEVEIKGDDVFLIEGKHSKTHSLPSSGDIKDGLLKMILFTNLEDVKIGTKEYKPVAVLKLTTKKINNTEKLSTSQKKVIDLLQKEANTNNFKIVLK